MGLTDVSPTGGRQTRLFLEVGLALFSWGSIGLFVLTPFQIRLLVNGIYSAFSGAWELRGHRFFIALNWF